MKFQFYRRIIFAVTVCFSVFAPEYSSGAGPEECQPVSINVDTENLLLTRTEIIELMDEAFYESLVEFEECVEKSSTGSGKNGKFGDVSSDSGIESAYLQGVQSDKSVLSESSDEEISSRNESIEANGIQGADEQVASDDFDKLLQGKIPDDIPAPDNDNALQTQIRRAAMQETDPELKEKLWNEYRRYKGLPEK